VLLEESPWADGGGALGICFHHFGCLGELGAAWNNQIVRFKRGSIGFHFAVLCLRSQATSPLPMLESVLAAVLKNAVNHL